MMEDGQREQKKDDKKIKKKKKEETTGILEEKETVQLKEEQGKTPEETTENNKKEKQEKVEAKPAEDSQMTDKQSAIKSRRRLYIIITIIVVILIAMTIAGIAYYKKAAYYQTHFFPNMRINGLDCSDSETAEIIELLDRPIQNYSLKITGRDCKTGEAGAIIGEITSGDIRLSFGDTKTAVEELLSQQKPYQWIWAYFGEQNDCYVEQSIVFDEGILETIIKSWDACRKSNMVKAEDAYISETPGPDGYYEIIPETVGTELDVNEVVRLAGEGIQAQQDVIDLEEEGCYREASVRQDDRKLTEVVDTANRWLSTSITYDWNGTEVILEHEKIAEWVGIEDGKAVLDEEGVADFVKEQAAAYDTYGKKKKFVTTLGTEITLLSRNYGWKTDTAAETEELIRLIHQGSSVRREPLYSVTAMQKGVNDIGNSYVEADLTNQHLYLYQNGSIVLETDFVSGTMVSTYDCVTPEGIFGLSYKTMNAVLKGATYRTPVSYWMPFYGNYGMHDASWRSSFGGQIFITNGSHGCINLPPDMAGQIYQYVSEGFPVICYYYGGAPYIGIQTQPAPEATLPMPETQPAPEATLPETTIPEQVPGEGE